MEDAVDGDSRVKTPRSPAWARSCRHLATDLQNLTDFSGTMAYKTGSSSDTNVLSLSSASAVAVAGTHTISVQNLAQTSSAASDAVKASDTLTGGITFKVGHWRLADGQRRRRFHCKDACRSVGGDQQC